MKRILPTLTLILSFLVLFNSCKKESIDPKEVEEGTAFYPLEIGHYVVYDVDSIIYDDLLKAELPFQCQLRYDVADTFTDAAGDPAYVINVRYRKSELESYVPHNVLYAKVIHNQLVVTENNLKFIKLVFPVTEGVNWNGNAMIPLGDIGNDEYNNNKWNYTYTLLDQSFDAGLQTFQHTVTVNEIDDALNDPDTDPDAFAYRNYSQEIYAYNVGMVYRERVYWVFQPEAPNGQGGGSGYRKGYSVIMRAVDHN